VDEDNALEAHSRPIKDIIGYSHVPLGDYTTLPVTEAGYVKHLENIKVHFVGTYHRLPGIDQIRCSLDIRIPDNWVSDAIFPRKFSLLITMTQYQLAPKPVHPSKMHIIEPPVRASKVDVNPVMPQNFSNKEKRFGQSLELDDLRTMAKAEREIDLLRLNSTATAAEKGTRLPSPRNLTFTYQDIEQRQKLIDRLLAELDSRTEAVKKIGNDLVAAKETNKALEVGVPLILS
jgi:hypothetical protein